MKKFNGVMGAPRGRFRLCSTKLMFVLSFFFLFIQTEMDLLLHRPYLQIHAV